MNSTSTCLLQNSDEEINRLTQSIFFVLTFCSLISNVVIYSDKILENNEINKNFKKINNTYTVLKEYFFNNYKEDDNGNILFEKTNEIPDNKVPVVPDSKKIEKEIKELINYQSPPPSIQKSKSLKKEINDFLNSDDEKESCSNININDKIDDNDLKHYHKSSKNNEDKDKIKQRNEEKIKNDKKHKKRDDKNIKVKKSQ
jgi:hypothetical protein